MPLTLTLTEAAAKIHDRDLSPVELVDAYLERIEELDGELGMYATVQWDRARDRARRIATDLARGRSSGPLAGIPYAVKDIVAVSGVPMGAGSKATRGLVSTRNAKIVDDLNRAGAVLLGTTRMFELALSSSESDVDADFVGPTNPWSADRTAGGSSSGSAAAVVAELCLFSIGTDTGGSVRIPAAFCGAVGMKPTIATVPASGIMPLSWSLDTPGFFTRTVDDSAAVSSALGIGSPGARLPAVAGMAVGVFAPTEGIDRLDPRFAHLLGGIGDALAHAGCEVRAIDLPMDPTWQTALSALVSYEAYRTHAATFEPAPDLMGSYVRDRMEAGARMSQLDYQAALDNAAACGRALDHALGELDVLLLPSVPFVAPTIADLARHGSRAHAHFTRPVNLAGLPAASVPVQGAGPDDLPLGVQVVGTRRSEDTVHAIARAVEAAVGRPPRWTPLRRR